MIDGSLKADHISSRTIRAINLRMEEDPVFYKKLSELILETIREYHQQRLSEAEYLKRAKENEETFLKGQQDDLPGAIQGKAIATSYFNLITDLLTPFRQTERKDQSAELALEVDACFHAQIFDGDKPIVDWQNNPDIEGKVKIALDDIFFDFQSKYNLELDLNQLDELVEEVLKVARIRYN